MSYATESLAMDRSMKQLQAFRKGMLFLLTLIGSGTVLLLAGAAGLRMLRNHPPDALSELVSPDGRYRIVITEELAGFPWLLLHQAGLCLRCS